MKFVFDFDYTEPHPVLCKNTGKSHVIFNFSPQNKNPENSLL